MTGEAGASGAAARPHGRARLRLMTGALSDLYLDTEVRWWIPRIAMLSLELEYDDSELFELWCYGVTPALWPNLRAVAGEWAGFEEDALVASVERNLTASPVRRWAWRTLYRARAPARDYDAVVRLRRELETRRQHDRDAFAHALTACAHLYFEAADEAHWRAELAARDADTRCEAAGAIIDGLGGTCRQGEPHTRAARDRRLRLMLEAMHVGASD